jgi:hypothetical protein
MSRATQAEMVFAKLQQERRTLAERQEAIETELRTIADRLVELNVIVPMMEAQLGGSIAAAPAVAATPAAVPTAAPTEDAPKRAGRKPGPKPGAKASAKPGPKPVRKKPGPKPGAKARAAAVPAAPARKGRRRASGVGELQDMGIVDAAIHLAKKHGIASADAGLVQAWFEEAGFKTRKGTPNRNSIYVSLNREFTEGPEKGRNRISRPDKGKFHFNEVTTKG